MNEKRIYRDFDLPTNHLPGNQHYIPRRARSQAEIERRRGLAPGTLLAEHQVRGLTIGSLILEHIHEPDDLRFTTKVLAVSGINTAWYGFARGSEDKVMRRRLKLPVLATGDAERRPDPMDLFPATKVGLRDAMLEAHMLVAAHQVEPGKVWERKKDLGRMIGNSAIALACIASPTGFDNHGETVSDFAAQNFVRQRGLWALHHGRTLAGELGSYPSVAQLADPDSDLGVYWRRHAPNGALEAYDQALASPLAA